MSRRMTKAESQGIGWLIVIGLPIYGLCKFGEEVGWGSIAAGTTAAIIGLVLIRTALKSARRRTLMEKYGDEKVVSWIMNHSFWQGQTAEQLRESLGNPANVDEFVFENQGKGSLEVPPHRQESIWTSNYRRGLPSCRLGSQIIEPSANS